MGKLQDKVAIVTGSTAGIGLGIVECFAEEGAKVVFCGRREELGKQIEADLKGKGYEVAFVRADVSVTADIELLFAKAKEIYGKVDILVNNAGLMRMYQLENMDAENDLDPVLNLNLRSYFISTKLAAKEIEEGGSIINIASIGGLSAAPTLSSYGATKAAVISLTRTSAVEFAAKGIRVNAICPGTIFSEMMPRDGEFTAATLAKIPMGRGGEPREIGTVAAFLASSEASYVTGVHIVVDGGMTA